MEFLLFICFVWPFKAIKSILGAIVGFLKFILRILGIEFLSKNGKNLLKDTESLIAKHWGSPLAIHDITTMVNGLTPLEMKPTSVELYPTYTNSVFSLPFHKLPKTAHYSFAVNGYRMARWQLYLYQEASFLLEKDKAYIIKHKPDSFSISVSKRFNEMNNYAIREIPIKDRLKLAYANALYAEKGKCFQLQSVYNLRLLLGKATIASLQFAGYGDMQNAWKAYYKGIHGSTPDDDTTQKLLSCPVSYADILTTEESSRVYNLLGLKNGVKNVDKLIKKYSPKPKKKKSPSSGIIDFFDMNSSCRITHGTATGNSELENIWGNAYERLFPKISDDSIYEGRMEKQDQSVVKTHSYSYSYSSSSSSGKSTSDTRISSSTKSTKTKEAKRSPKRDTRYEEERVRQCQAELARQKQNRDTAKQNGNYKRSAKNYRRGDKVGNVYDSNVWNAEEQLKRAKEALANAKKR